jgi:dTMP kinase
MNGAVFITFEGIDGAGKSSQIARLAKWLEERGRKTRTCRDPGSTLLGNKLREILLNDPDIHPHRRAEMLLYMAARAQLVEEIIRPGLAAEEDVLSDRFLLSNVAYQAYGNGYGVDGIEEVWRVGEAATGGLVPHVTFVLDLSAEAALARLDRSHDKLESRGCEYLERVRQGFLTEGARRREIAVVDANRSPDDVHRQIIAELVQRLPALQGAAT